MYDSSPGDHEHYTPKTKLLSFRATVLKTAKCDGHCLNANPQLMRGCIKMTVVT